MSIIMSDDFTGYGTDDTASAGYLLDAGWGEVSGTYIVPDPDPLAIGNVLDMVRTSGSSRLRFPFNISGAASVGVSFRLWCVALPSSAVPIIRFQAIDNRFQGQLVLYPNGAVQFAWGDIYTAGSGPDQGVFFGSPTGPVVTARSWNHFEIKLLRGYPSTGAMELRFNGVSVLSVTGVGAGSDVGQLGIGTSSEYNIGQRVQAYMKDLVLWNSLGTQNNDFLGTVQVIGLIPDTDVSFPWVPSTGIAGFSLINNSPPQDSAKFISAISPPPAPAIFGLSDLPPSVTSVRALCPQIRSRKVDGGDGATQTTLISGVSNISGGVYNNTTSYAYRQEVFEIDPATTAPWTPSSVNAVKLQLNRTI